jgi:hypothetical protein
MSKEEALAIVNDQKIKNAFLQFWKSPMTTDRKTYYMALQFCDAIVALDS